MKRYAKTLGLIADVCCMLGCLSLIYAAWLIYVPLAYVVIGVVLIAASLILVQNLT